LSVSSFRPGGELGRLLDVMADTSDVRLRAALEAREQARARKEDALNAIEMAESAEEMSDLQALAQDSEGALEAASQAVDHALGMKRQAINAGHGIVPGTTPESFAEAHVDLLDELVVDLECCPRARKTLLRHTPSPPAGHAAELALSKSKLTVLAVSIALLLACASICFRRYCRSGGGAPRVKSARTASTRGRRAYQNARPSCGPRTYDDDDDDDWEVAADGRGGISRPL